MTVYITDAYRTPVGIKGGIFKEVGAAELASPVLAKLYSRLAFSLDEVILGNVTGPGGNIARLASLTAGIPETVPGITVDRQCASGLEAIRLGASLVNAGEADTVIAGGCESSSTSPRPEKAVFSPEWLGDPEMGIAAEGLAGKEKISRQAQDEYAILSYKRYYQSVESQLFQKEIIPLNGFLADEAGMKKRPVEKMATRAKPAFMAGGTVTALNSSAFNDAACAVSLSSKKASGLKVIAFAAAGADPKLPAAAPVPAIKKVLQKTGLTTADIDRWEINEAFAVKILYIAQQLSIPIDKINPDGGGLALGHPYGASGAMLVLRLFYGLKKQGRYGIAAIGSAGGTGVAMLVEQI